MAPTDNAIPRQRKQEKEDGLAAEEEDVRIDHAEIWSGHSVVKNRYEWPGKTPAPHWTTTRMEVWWDTMLSIHMASWNHGNGGNGENGDSEHKQRKDKSNDCHQGLLCSEMIEKPLRQESVAWRTATEYCVLIHTHNLLTINDSWWIGRRLNPRMYTDQNKIFNPSSHLQSVLHDYEGEYVCSMLSKPVVCNRHFLILLHIHVVCVCEWLKSFLVVFFPWIRSGLLSEQHSTSIWWRKQPCIDFLFFDSLHIHSLLGRNRDSDKEEERQS